MVFGTHSEERIQLNEETYWSPKWQMVGDQSFYFAQKFSRWWR
jgi:hypothetical protein